MSSNQQRNVGRPLHPGYILVDSLSYNPLHPWQEQERIKVVALAYQRQRDHGHVQRSTIFLIFTFYLIILHG